MMERIEGIVFWVTVFLYMTAFLQHLFAFTRQSDRGVRRALTLLWAGLGMNTLLLALHWIATGHPPVVDACDLNFVGVALRKLPLEHVFEQSALDSQLESIDRDHCEDHDLPPRQRVLLADILA